MIGPFGLHESEDGDGEGGAGERWPRENVGTPPESPTSLEELSFGNQAAPAASRDELRQETGVRKTVPDMVVDNFHGLNFEVLPDP
ncbi:hypothetical protein CYMTET_13554 [Cymbomonas tetramitiformis]|uniref:Uncharacterized protein n=1 Tax=Cymbomonas tetramitiformis TaxID=36881 RepID=A0AAE0GJD4_9CHLO|nr:hypothetical protein CYMTET_13554 [Cymbomonas tetramitiformis]